MVKLCLMASHGHPPGPGFVFHQEQGMCRVVKPCLPIQRMKQEIIRPSSVSLMPYDEPWTPISSFCESRQIVKFDSTVKRPILIDMQDNVVNSILFSILVTEQCAKHERILRFLTSGHSEVEKGKLDFPALSELMELQALAFDEHRQLYFPSLVYPSMEVDTAKHLLDVVGHIYSSKMSVQSDGQVPITPITSSGTKMEDILSILTEFYLLNTTTKWRKESLVPPFSRLNIIDAQHNKHTSSLKLEAVTATPLKSPGKLKHKPSLRKKNSKKGGTARDLYKTNYFHACESLLSLMISKKWQGKTPILSLKKSGPELPELLNQFSAGIAGTGIAVVFSVMCKLACGRVPLSGSKLLSSGFGFGLVWLSWAVNRLRDTIVYINKNTKKVGLKEEEMMTRVDRSVNEIYFRAATLLAVAVLRFA
ncbi:uncharacterized protein LOC119984852 isoform X2 [Tripterygium wilfordii]|uniref:uncharacterized protein LOC119984852 isoform X2 n=1 Tax=Tripterygium wilfordii TaxID=458696 RepID=UPI0018F851D2|nr:uncharacterized protein LOC119984852 isoform X2 [Tripterygium wilfordii]